MGIHRKFLWDTILQCSLLSGWPQCRYSQYVYDNVVGDICEQTRSSQHYIPLPAAAIPCELWTPNCVQAHADNFYRRQHLRKPLKTPTRKLLSCSCVSKCARSYTTVQHIFFNFPRDIRRPHIGEALKHPYAYPFHTAPQYKIPCLAPARSGLCNYAVLCDPVCLSTFMILAASFAGVR